MTRALTVGVFTSISLTASGGTKPYTYSIISGLPAGLSLNASTGVISGTPTTVQASTAIAWQVEDALAATATDSFNVVVQAVPVAVPHYRFLVELAGLFRLRGALAVANLEVDAAVGLALGGIGVGAAVAVDEPEVTVGIALGGIGIGADVEAVPFATVGIALGGIGVGADAAVDIQIEATVGIALGGIGVGAETEVPAIEELRSELSAAAVSAGGSGLANWSIWLADEYDSNTATNQGSLSGDLSGTGHSPTISSGALNGRDAWDFNGSSHYLDGSAPSYSAGEHSLFALVDPDLLHTGIFASVYRGTDQTDNQFQYATLSGGNWLLRVWDDVADTYRNFSGSGSYTAGGGEYLVSVVAEAATLTGHIDGSALSGASNNGSYLGVNTTSAFDLIIGAQEGLAGNITAEQTFFDGKVFIVAICDLDLNSAASGAFATARERVEAAIDTYYGR